MRIHHSPTLGDVHFTEEQYHKLLRRFNPNKKIGKTYQYPCICPKPIDDESPFDGCHRCKPFGNVMIGCIRYMDEIMGTNRISGGVYLGTTNIEVITTSGITRITKIYNILLAMEKV